MNFSIVLPTRGDEKNIRPFLDSIERTTYDKTNIEVLLAIDEGRGDIPHNISKQDYSFSIHYFERPQTDNFSRDYYNWLANKSTGNNIWCLNDDAFIITQDWDKKILEKVGTRKIYLVDTFDSTKNQYQQEFCCFPMVSREAMNICGYILNPAVRMYPADKFLFETYKHADAIINANDIYIVHNHIHESDPSKSKMQRIFQEDCEKWKTQKIEIGSEVSRLKYFKKVYGE